MNGPLLGLSAFSLAGTTVLVTGAGQEAIYLASSASRWVTGHVLVVDGGFTAR